MSKEPKDIDDESDLGQDYEGVTDMPLPGEADTLDLADLTEKVRDLEEKIQELGERLDRRDEDKAEQETPEELREAEETIHVGGPDESALVAIAVEDEPEATEAPCPLFGVKVVKDGGGNGSSTLDCTWTYTVTDLTGAFQYGTGFSPGKRRMHKTIYHDPGTDANYGAAYLDVWDSVQLWDANETPDTTDQGSGYAGISDDVETPGTVHVGAVSVCTLRFIGGRLVYWYDSLGTWHPTTP